MGVKASWKVEELMELNEYQKLAQDTAVYPKSAATDGLVYAVLALCGETGELANKLKKSLRSQTPPDVMVLADELGDCLWYCGAVAERLGLSLQTIAEMNLEKLAERRAKNAIKEHA